MCYRSCSGDARSGPMPSVNDLSTGAISDAEHTHCIRGPVCSTLFAANGCLSTDPSQMQWLTKTAPISGAEYSHSSSVLDHRAQGLRLLPLLLGQATTGGFAGARILTTRLYEAPRGAKCGTCHAKTINMALVNSHLSSCACYATRASFSSSAVKGSFSAPSSLIGAAASPPPAPACRRRTCHKHLTK